MTGEQLVAPSLEERVTAIETVLQSELPAQLARLWPRIWRHARPIRLETVDPSQVLELRAMQGPRGLQLQLWLNGQGILWQREVFFVGVGK